MKEGSVVTRLLCGLMMFGAVAQSLGAGAADLGKDVEISCLDGVYTGS